MPGVLLWLNIPFKVSSQMFRPKLFLAIFEKKQNKMGPLDGHQTIEHAMALYCIVLCSVLIYILYIDIYYYNKQALQKETTVYLSRSKSCLQCKTLGFASFHEATAGCFGSFGSSGCQVRSNSSAGSRKHQHHQTTPHDGTVCGFRSEPAALVEVSGSWQFNRMNPLKR